MSYDIYCYKSPTGVLDPDEVEAILEADQDKWIKDVAQASYKDQTVALLKACNSRLDISELSANLQNKSSRKNIRHIEINPAEGDPVIQITVYDNHVFFSMPYWYKGSEAQNAMGILKSYIKALRTNLGYFVYDPQTGEVFDPAENDFKGLATYLSVSEHLDDIVSRTDTQTKNERPWWKFWA